MYVRDAGDRALVIEFGDAIRPDLVAHVQNLDRRLTNARADATDGPLAGIVETVPSFRSLAIIIDPLRTTPAEVFEAVQSLPLDTAADQLGSGRHWEIPVCYGGLHGPDLDAVARLADLDRDEVIARHVDTPVTVYLLGFVPGFAFMGDIDSALRLPRRSEPRLQVPPGSVGIAMSLTAVYPWASPGGWHLLGHSPVPMFNAQASPAALLAPGDHIRFRAISARQHRELDEALNAGDVLAASFQLRPSHV